MTSESAKQLTALLRDTVAPLLKREGFKRTRNRWVRQVGDVYQVVEAQGSAFGPAFCVNLGVVYPAVEALLGWAELSITAVTSGYARLGNVAFGRDVWWMNADPADGTEVAELLVRFGLPWLNDRLDPRVLATETDGSVRAAFLIAAGNTAAALEVFDDETSALAAASSDEEREDLRRYLGFTREVLERAGLM